MLAALPFLMCYSGLTLALCLQDLRHGLLPDRYTCPLLWSGLLFYLCLAPHQLHDAVWGAIGGYLCLAALYWLYRGIRGYEGLGYGDIKYLAALGAWHGWQLLPQLLLVASLLAGMTWMTLALFRRSKQQRWGLNNPLPFGPFLTAAGFCCGCQTLASLTL
ncbi:TPA: prepilin peptidase [Klebsiella quasipneumoniae subsp. similipneumoniae]|nr:prepilin peptidase [Klebsiella quasipneumoniae subsp. similipneumoniae]